MIIKLEKQDKKTFVFSIKTESGELIGTSKKYRAKASAKKALSSLKRNLTDRSRIENAGMATCFVVRSSNGTDFFQSGVIADRGTAQTYIDVLAKYLSSDSARLFYNGVYENI